jgi:hypothetical protein
VFVVVKNQVLCRAEMLFSNIQIALVKPNLGWLQHILSCSRKIQQKTENQCYSQPINHRTKIKSEAIICGVRYGKKKRLGATNKPSQHKETHPYPPLPELNNILSQKALYEIPLRNFDRCAFEFSRL